MLCLFIMFSYFFFVRLHCFFLYYFLLDTGSCRSHVFSSLFSSFFDSPQLVYLRSVHHLKEQNMRQYWRERRKRVVSMVSKKVGHDHVEEALRKKSPRVPRGIDENDSCMRYAVGGKKRNVHAVHTSGSDLVKKIAREVCVG